MSKVDPEITAAQMQWMLNKGYAWPDPDNNGSNHDVYYTRESTYQWFPPTVDDPKGHYRPI